MKKRFQAPFKTSFQKNGKETLRTPEILFLTSYPPRECGIATYSQDLIKPLSNKFSDSFSLKVCPLESGDSIHGYPDEVKYTIDTNDPAGYLETARAINNDERIGAVVVQHEFAFFQDAGEEAFLPFLYRLINPVVVVFHTVLPHPAESLKVTPFSWTATDKYVTIKSESSAFSKTWILIENQGKFQKWKSTDGSNQIQTLELKKQ